MVPVAVQAAKRWGLQNPSFDDVLMEATPRYNEDPGQTKRWHALKDEALALIDPVHTHGMCPVCNVMPLRHRNAMTCSRRQQRKDAVCDGPSPAELLHMRAMHADGGLVAEIARSLDVAWSTVRRWMDDDGLVPHNHRNRDSWGDAKRHRCKAIGCRNMVTPPKTHCGKHR